MAALYGFARKQNSEHPQGHKKVGSAMGCSLLQEKAANQRTNRGLFILLQKYSISSVLSSKTEGGDSAMHKAYGLTSFISKVSNLFFKKGQIVSGTNCHNFDAP